MNNKLQCFDAETIIAILCHFSAGTKDCVGFLRLCNLSSKASVPQRKAQSTQTSFYGCAFLWIEGQLKVCQAKNILKQYHPFMVK